jgi:16S rRNA (guanine1207-N2)-methyltransferase
LPILYRATVADNPRVPHYFDREPQAASQPRPVTLRLPDLEVRLTSDHGVFARGGVDRGTQFLLRRGPAPPPSGEVLDLGCGYGPIAITGRALELAARNAASAGAANVVAIAPEDVPTGIRFSAIYSNPPVRIGLARLHPLLVEWLDRLLPGGAAYLVVHRHLGSDSLARWLAGEGFATERVASHDGYRILRVQPRTAVEDDR